jgi:hypothetical protein
VKRGVERFLLALRRRRCPPRACTRQQQTERLRSPPKMGAHSRIRAATRHFCHVGTSRLSSAQPSLREPRWRRRTPEAPSAAAPRQSPHHVRHRTWQCVAPPRPAASAPAPCPCHPSLLVNKRIRSRDFATPPRLVSQPTPGHLTVCAQRTVTQSLHDPSSLATLEPTRRAPDILPPAYPLSLPRRRVGHDGGSAVGCLPSEGVTTSGQPRGTRWRTAVWPGTYCPQHHRIPCDRREG